MSVRLLAPLVLALASCQTLDDLLSGDACPGMDPSGCPSWSECNTDPSDPAYGICGGTMYRCEDGEWVIDGWCEPWPIAVDGPLTLAQTVTGGTCAALAPRDPLVVTGDTDTRAVTAEEPVVVVEGSIVSNYRDAAAAFTVTDDWAGVAVTVAYDLYLRWDGVISGTAAATTADCDATLDVTGTFEPLWLP